MSNSKMLIDAAHPEETRVVVLKGNRVEEFDFESASKKQLRGNIYLAKVTRVEPSLQAAFIEYGGNRHGFLAFSEIHPDYYQIPFADRQALLEEEARAHRDEDEEPRSSGENRGGENRGGENRGGENRGGENRGGEGRGRDAKRGGGDGGERSARGEGRGEGRGERSGKSDRNERGQRRSRRHRRDQTTALDRRDPADESVSEPAFASGEEQRDAALITTSEAEGGIATGDAGDRADATSSDDATEVSSSASDTAADESRDPESPALVEAASAEAFASEDDAIDHDATTDDVTEAQTAEAPAIEEPEASETDDRPEAQARDTDAPAVSAAAEESGLDAAAPADDEVEAEVLSSADGQADEHAAEENGGAEPDAEPVEARDVQSPHDDDHRTVEQEEEHVEQIGGDALSDVAPRPTRLRRHYKIQEVIKRRQILLIQVVKEERGNKGAALTTYLSLAGRYSVLMPNTAKGGGISRKITDGEDRKRLKAIAGELDVPEGMGVILRTAGASRSPIEVKRDFEYLLRMWESVRELTLKSSAPTLVYEEGSLIKRSIRDLYSKEVEEIVVSGEAGFAEARDFMRMLMPGNVKSVQSYRDPQPIFAKSGVEAQLDAMFSPHVTLKSGGYLVINQTEALVAIDVNSGRSTREHNIEDTALRTNLEAADEVARQLRLRDLAGLIVVDFIDMEEGRNNRAVERRIKEALKNDRARIQIGRISHFGLLEMSRQRIRTGVLEGSTIVCPHCAGAGTVRSTASIALHVLRLVEDALLKDASYDLVVRSRAEVALYMLNQKRAKLVELELRFGVGITVAADPTLTGMVYHAIERGELALPPMAPAPRQDLVRVDSIAPIFEPEAEIEEVVDTAEQADAPDLESGGDGIEAATGETGDGEGRRRKRRRRRRGRDRDAAPGEENEETADSADEVEAAGEAPLAPADADDEDATASDVAETAIAPAEAPVVAAEAAVQAPADLAVPVADAVEEPVPVTAAPSPAAEPEPVVEEAPKRRRSRRTAARIAEEAAAEAAPASEPVVVAEEAPARPRRRRPSRARAAEAGAEGATPDAAETAAAAPALVAAEAPEPIAVSDVEAPSASSAEAPDDAPAGIEPSSVDEGDAASAEPDADRPKRSGWWQRAKASFGP